MSYNHAYTIAFEVPGCQDEDSEVTLRMDKDRVIAALLKRVALFVERTDELVEAAGPAFDSYEEEAT